MPKHSGFYKNSEFRKLVKHEFNNLSIEQIEKLTKRYSSWKDQQYKHIKRRNRKNEIERAEIERDEMNIIPCHIELKWEICQNIGTIWTQRI